MSSVCVLQHLIISYHESEMTMPETNDLSDADQRLWATLIHVGAIIFWWIPSLIGYLVLKDRGTFIRDHTRTALNFQITLFIAEIIGGALAIIGIGLLILLAASIVNIIFSIIAAVKANNGEPYVYPLTITFVK